MRARSQGAFLALTLLLGFALRLSHALAAARLPFNYMSDASRYFEWAERILRGQDPALVYHQSPLYPHFQALIFLLFGTSVTAVLVVQAVMGTASCLLAYLLTRAVFSSGRIGILAALLLAVSGPSIFYDGLMDMATLVMFLGLLAVLLAVTALERGSRWLWCATGAAFGLCALARGVALFFLPVLAVYIAVHLGAAARRAESPPRRSLFGHALRQGALPAGLVALSALVTIAPVTIRNSVKGKDPVLIATHYGIAFFEGNNPGANGQYTEPPGLDSTRDFDGTAIAEYLEGRSLSPSGVARFWLGESWKFISGQPADFLRLLARKAAYFWNNHEIPNYENYAVAKQYSGVLRLPLAPFSVLAIPGLLGLALALRSGNAKAALAALFVFSYMTPVILCLVVARYRVSIAPFLAMFAAYALFSVLSWFRSKERRRLAFAAAGAAAFALLVFFPVPGLNPRRDYADGLNNIGTLYLNAGKGKEAELFYKLALRQDPDLEGPYNNLVRLSLDAGRATEALERLEQAVAAHPDWYFTHMNLGIISSGLGLPEKARQHFATALPHLPYSLYLRKKAAELGLR